MNISRFLGKKYHIDINVYIWLFVCYNILAFNRVFFQSVYVLTQSYSFIFGAFIIVAALMMLCCLVLFYKSTLKPISYILLLLNGGISYFIDTYQVAINEEMLVNVLETNAAESFDLLNGAFLLHLLLYTVLPIFIIRHLIIDTKNFWKKRVICFLSCIALLCSVVLPFSGTVFPFIHEHKPVKYFLIPVNYVGSIISFAKHKYRDYQEFTPIGNDAKFTQYWQSDKKLLIIFVVGETARAENFSFNGYERGTNDALEKYRDDIINFTQASSCGTSTAVSVPCMFSKDAQKDFSRGSAEYTGNVLDILQASGYRVIWYENNSDCKDVCNRVEQVFPCPYLIGTCTDDVMLLHLKEKINESLGNTFIAMHQIGSHGPKYYARYPEKSAIYQPTCQTEKIADCTSEELINTYDNTIAYTSQNIADLIKKLKKLKNEYDIILFYVSDHGESLGEHGFYLHSAPYSVAPQKQTHIPFFIWAEEDTLADLKIDKKCLQKKENQAVSHDNIFHSLLGLSGISAAEYQRQLDLFADCHR